MEHLNNFTKQILNCANCNAPLEINIAGEKIHCPYCKAENHFEKRSIVQYTPNFEPLTIPEEKRIELFETQLKNSPKKENIFKELKNINRFNPEKISQALKIVEDLYSKISNKTSIEASEQLLELLILLGDYYRSQKELLKERALFERAIRHIHVPRIKQQILGWFVRDAICSEDLNSAENWLSLMESKSLEITSDSEFRLCTSMIALFKKEWQTAYDIFTFCGYYVPIDTSIKPHAVFLICRILRELTGEKSSKKYLYNKIKTNGIGMLLEIEHFQNTLSKNPIWNCDNQIQFSKTKYYYRKTKLEQRDISPSTKFGEYIFGALIMIAGTTMIFLHLTSVVNLTSTGEHYAVYGISSFAILFGFSGILKGRHTKKKFVEHVQLCTNGTTTTATVLDKEKDYRHPSNSSPRETNLMWVTVECKFANMSKTYQSRSLVVRNNYVDNQLKKGDIIVQRYDSNIDYESLVSESASDLDINKHIALEL